MYFRSDLLSMIQHFQAFYLCFTLVEKGIFIIRKTAKTPKFYRLSRYNTIVGTATQKGEHGEAKLGVKFPSAGNIESPYWILDTDYVSYSVVFTCNDFGLFNYQFAWVLTREPFPSDGTIRAADYVLKANGVSLEPFSKTSHKNCP
ncbi:Hypothetical predicted protein [Cloeon dipterum]|uniref:Apolipoprotein D n=1 Tax=Cloeon dipterum TaxID=197152 RepID=A0A8S1D0Y5_9INSE|nr:Hypothetical predicted protein [Cloeon dipterum]